MHQRLAAAAIEHGRAASAVPIGHDSAPAPGNKSEVPEPEDRRRQQERNDDYREVIKALEAAGADYEKVRSVIELIEERGEGEGDAHAGKDHQRLWNYVRAKFSIHIGKLEVEQDRRDKKKTAARER